MNRLSEFEENIRSNRTAIVGFIRSNIKASVDAEDIFQKASLTMWKKYEAFDKETSFFSWATTIAKFQANNYRRSVQRCPVTFDSEMYDVVCLQYKTEFKHEDERYEILQTALNSLDQDIKELLIKVYVNGEQIKELAEKSGVPVQTLYNKVNVAKKKLVKFLNK